MNTNLGVFIVSAVVAVVAIAAATIAVVLSQIDGSSFSAIIGAAIGAAGTSSAHAVVANGREKNDTRKETP